MNYRVNFHYWPLVLGATGAVILAGCGNAGTNSSATLVAADASAPLATPTTKPTPRPTPLWQGQLAIPKWAKGQKVNHVPIAPKTKLIALTFDDGPWPVSTREVLEVLREKGVKATFYMVGQEVTRRPEIAREVRDAGHAIGNHSWDHPARPRDPQMQIDRTNAAIFRATGIHPSTFRPPYGIMGKMAHIAEKQGDAVLLWSADSNDWAKPGTERIIRNILSEAGPGGITLMHDGGGDRSQGVRALPIIIDSLRERGYQFVTVPELLRARVLPKPKPKPTKKAKPAKAKKAKS